MLVSGVGGCIDQLVFLHPGAVVLLPFVSEKTNLQHRHECRRETPHHTFCLFMSDLFSQKPRRSKDKISSACEPTQHPPTHPSATHHRPTVCTQEYALKAVDVLARRTRLAFIDSKAALEAAPRVIEIMSGLLGWSWSRRKEEMREVGAVGLWRVGGGWVGR